MLERLASYQRQLLIFGTILIAGLILFFLMNRNNQQSGKVVEDAGMYNQTEETVASSVEQNESPLYFADIKGGVKQPGMYQISENTRLADLIALAGGVTSEAEVEVLNLALKIEDQMLIYVPIKGQEPPLLAEVASGGNQAASESGASADGKININVATSLELQELDGIGPKKAEAIITYREDKGSFAKPEDLMEISGIGEKIFANLVDKVSVK